ncbi:Orf113 [Heliothis zea nudivirus]|uniref:Orf113 n=1 Tax=Heliothis zea nudivirus 1 TaxID=3116536 RepID=Q8JKK0_9VIRU|nr:Orf113 [Heliothis zea nudivirus]AAN04406.1 Orf113 [Heliothis zea nudivirus]
MLNSHCIRNAVSRLGVNQKAYLHKHFLSIHIVARSEGFLMSISNGEFSISI